MAITKCFLFSYLQQMLLKYGPMAMSCCRIRGLWAALTPKLRNLIKAYGGLEDAVKSSGKFTVSPEGIIRFTGTVSICTY